MADRRGRWWLALGMVVVLAAGVAWLTLGGEEEALLDGTFLRSFESAVDGGHSALWIDDPTELVAQLEQFLGEESGSTELLISPRVTQLLPKAKEVLIQLNSERRVSVEVRVSAGWVVLAKAMGIVRSDPWMGGGRVSLQDEQGVVRWRKSGGFAANLWSLEQLGFEAPLAAPGTTGPVRDTSALLALPDGDLWALGYPRSHGALTVSKVGAASLASVGSTAAQAEVDPLDAMANGSDFANEVAALVTNPLVIAVNRTGADWQALLWLDSPVVIDGRSVSLEIPRAAMLKSSPTLGWELPAERIARSLSATVEEGRSPKGNTLRALSPIAMQELSLQEPTLFSWAMAQPDGATGIWVEPASLTVWFEALAKMQESLPVSSSEKNALSSFADVLRDSGPLGTLMRQLSPLVIQSSEDTVTVRAQTQSL